MTGGFAGGTTDCDLDYYECGGLNITVAMYEAVLHGCTADAGTAVSSAFLCGTMGGDRSSAHCCAWRVHPEMLGWCCRGERRSVVGRCGRRGGRDGRCDEQHRPVRSRR